ncbi:MFS transporter [Verticiella sediminum]|uniref:MFS transporter n=1 Tax=Verticiella sediminum TaxID=1247510 RepID=A0A556AXE7_9BURK|nr:MFS transporter [Verticiella sediminum]TSH97601.1 MFS transporter [Verticiella sediminum]
MTASTPRRPAHVPLPASLLLGIAQILVWGASFFLLSVLAEPIHRDTGWPLPWIYGALTVSILVSALLSPRANVYIARRRGRRLLIVSGWIIAGGLAIVGAAPNFPVFFAGWCLIGVGMAGALYDPLFTTLGLLYGQAARPAINAVTLVAGFTTTLVWPIQAWMEASMGWRTTCLVYAGVTALVLLPIYLKALPPDGAARTDAPPPSGERSGAALPGTAPAAPLPRADYLLLSLVFSIAAIIMTAVVVQMIVMLQGVGHSATAAIALAALIGPSMVAMRVLTLFLKRLHPTLMALVSAAFVAVGLLLLSASPQAAALGIVCYGIGNGLRALVRGTLPLALLPPAALAPVMGRLSRSSLFCQALTPLACGFVIAHAGAAATLWLLTALAALNLGLTFWLRLRVMRARGVG